MRVPSALRFVFAPASSSVTERFFAVPGLMKSARGKDVAGQFAA
jgi:hypothetical protein